MLLRTGEKRFVQLIAFEPRIADVENKRIPKRRCPAVSSLEKPRLPIVQLLIHLEGDRIRREFFLREHALHDEVDVRKIDEAALGL
jgi:hypothetical protein